MAKNIQYDKIEWAMVEELAKRHRPRLRPELYLKELLKNEYAKRK